MERGSDGESQGGQVVFGVKGGGDDQDLHHAGRDPPSAGGETATAGSITVS